MSDTKKTTVSLPLGREREYFPPEIVFDDNDHEKCTPVVYLPKIIIAENQSPNAVLTKTAWEVFLKKLKKDYANAQIQGVADISGNLKELTDDEGNGIIYIPLDEDKGQPPMGKTTELHLCRYGKHVVRVYGPEKVIVWETVTAWAPSEDQYFPVLLEREIDLSGNEQLMIFHQLPQESTEMEKTYHIDTSAPDPESYDGRVGNMAFKNESSYKNGRFFQQQKDVDTFDVVSYSTEFTWAGKEFVRTFVVPGNGNDYRGNQIRRIGRKKHVIREILRFNGNTDQSIKYWYDDPVVKVLSWTQFIDEEGKILTYRPNNAPVGKDYAREKIDFSPKRGRTFHADKKCWGSLWVEYTTFYTEFEIIYDFPNPVRHFEVLAGNVERIGYQVLDKKGKVVDRGDSLKGNDFAFDRKVPDLDWIRENRNKVSPDKPPPEIAVRLFNKIQLKPFTVPKIDILYTNGRQAATATFNPPQPNFMDMPVDELPKVAIFEKRVKELKGGAYVEHVEEITYLDIMGNVRSEKLERRRDEEKS